MRQLASEWVKHLDRADPTKKQDFVNAIRNSTVVINRLKDIVHERIKALDHNENLEASFDVPGWDYKQAYRIGRRKELQELSALFNFLDQ